MTMILALALAVQEDTLKPLTEIATELNRGIGEFLSGKSPAEAFPIWKDDTRKPDELRKVLADAGIASAECFGFEFELILHKEGKAVYYLRAFVHADGKETALVEIRGQAADQNTDPGKPLDEFTEKNSPFAEAAKALKKSFEGDGWKQIPFLNPEKLKKLIQDEKIQAEILRDADRSKKRIESIAGEIAALKADEIRIRIDDAVFLVRDKDRNVLGTLGADFDSVAGKPVDFTLKRYEPLKK